MIQKDSGTHTIDNIQSVEICQKERVPLKKLKVSRLGVVQVQSTASANGKPF